VILTTPDYSGLTFGIAFRLRSEWR